MSYSLYRPSGVVPAGAYLLAAACLAASVPLGGLYAWLNLHLPAALGFVATCALAFALASLAKGVCGAAPVRSPAWIGAFGLLLGLGAWYVQWAAWTALQLGVDALALLVQPELIVGAALKTLSSTSSAVAGMPVKYLTILAWLGELWMLLFFPQYIGKMRAEKVFDEAAGRWADYVELPLRFRKIDQPALIGMLTAPSGRLSDILVPDAGTGSAGYSALQVYRCRGADPLVSIVNLDTRGKEGRARPVACAPGLYLHVPEAELEALSAGTPAPAALGEADPPELLDAIAHVQAGRFQAACAEALPYVGAADLRLSSDANRICAIAYSEAKEWGEACAYWRALFAREATAHNALQIATSAIMAGQLAQGIHWGERACALNASLREVPAISIVTNLVSALTAAGQLEAALPYLDQIKAFYTELHVTDPTFLFVRQMPLFHVFLEKSGVVVKEVLDPDESRAWYVSMLPHLDERGQAELNAWLAGADVPA